MGVLRLGNSSRFRRRSFYSGPKRRPGRFVRSILLLPASMPKLSREKTELLKRICEMSGILLILSVMGLMVAGEGFAKTLTLITAFVFTGSFMMIRIRMYQDSLVDHGYME